MIGKKFSMLTVLEECKERDKHRRKIYKCRCNCSNITYVSGNKLKQGNTKSCGCLKNINHYTSHGKSDTRLYSTWSGIKKRCYCKNNKDYKYYGARGIKVCDEWLHDFMNFYNWAMNNGYRDDLTIDRIDNDGDYKPSNCRFVDMKTQNNNQRKNMYLTYNNKTMTISEWSKYLNVPHSTISWRKHQGYDDTECLFGRVDNGDK